MPLGDKLLSDSDSDLKIGRHVCSPVRRSNNWTHLALRAISKAWFWDTLSRYYAVRNILSFSSMAKLQWYHVWCLSQELWAEALLHFEVACCAGPVENSFNVLIVAVCHVSSLSMKAGGIKISFLNPRHSAACHHMLSVCFILPPLRAATCYLLPTQSINRAHTALGCLEERLVKP